MGVLGELRNNNALKATTMETVTSEEIEIQNNVSEYYENIRYSNEYSIMYQRYWFELMSKLMRKKGSILDNGCGIGNLAEHLPNQNVVGLDISNGMLRKAKKRMRNLVKADSQLLPFDDESFDVIFCRGLLHHLPNSELAVEEIKRVLKKDGELVVAEPIKSLLSYPRKLIKGSGHFSKEHEDFEREELIKMLEEVFYVKEIKYFGYIAYPLLGFPDVFNVFKYVPFKKVLSSILIQIDNAIARIPYIKTQSWGIIIKCVKGGI